MNEQYAKRLSKVQHYTGAYFNVDTHSSAHMKHVLAHWQLTCARNIGKLTSAADSRHMNKLTCHDMQ